MLWKNKSKQTNVNGRKEEGRRKERERRNAREGIGMFMTYVFICFVVAVYLFA